jgi:tetratricopeptide (TPR) repeat protein
MSNTPYKKNVLEHSTLQTNGNVHIGDITYIVNEKAVTIPTLLTNNIPSNADHILGRIDELTAIAKYLEQNKPTVLVNGIGGIGKTSVATKYVATYKHQYKHIAWLTVQSSVAEAFANDLVLLKSLHIEQDVRKLIETQRLTDAFKLVIHKLNTLDKTLVVLDNANNPDDLLAHKNLFDTAKCHYLITSRTQPQDWTIVEIDHLPADEAVNLFRKLAPSVLATDDNLKALLSKLFFHTLLIELVAKAVEIAGFSFAELQTMIETKFIHDTQLNEDIVSTGKHGNSVADNAKRAKIEEYIWLIFSNVRDLGDDAKQVMRGMALLPVATPFDRPFLKEHLALFDVKDIIPNLSLLVEWGWLHKEGRGFKLHPLIADVVVEHLNINPYDSERYIFNIAVLIDYDNYNPKDNIFEKNKEKAKAERLAYLFFDEYTAVLGLLFDKLSTLEICYGYFQKAAEYAERALKIMENLFDEPEMLITSCQNNLANVYRILGKYELSIQLLEKALKNDLLIFGEEHSNVAMCRANLGHAFRELELFEKALEYFELALKSDIKNYGKNHPIIASRFSNLGNIFRLTGQFEDAVKLSESALEIALNNFGDNHPDVAIYQSNLGNIYLDLKRYDEAIYMYESALSFNTYNFGVDSVVVGTNQLNLGCVYDRMDNYEKANYYWQLSYQNHIKNFEIDHPYILGLKKMLELSNKEKMSVLNNPHLLKSFAGLFNSLKLQIYILKQ